MIWMLAGMALAAYSAGSQMNAANKDKSEAYTDSMKGVTSKNDAIMEANTSNVIRTGYKVGLQQLQTARAKKAAIEQGYDLSKAGLEALSNATANSAAAGTIGSSVDAVKGNIEKKIDEANIGLDVSFDQMMENANIALDQTIMGGIDQQLASIKVNQTLPSQGDAFKSAIIAGASSFAKQYAGGSMSLGK